MALRGRRSRWTGYPQSPRRGAIPVRATATSRRVADGPGERHLNLHAPFHSLTISARARRRCHPRHADHGRRPHLAPALHRAHEPCRPVAATPPESGVRAGSGGEDVTPRRSPRKIQGRRKPAPASSGPSGWSERNGHFWLCRRPSLVDAAERNPRVATKFIGGPCRPFRTPSSELNARVLLIRQPRVSSLPPSERAAARRPSVFRQGSQAARATGLRGGLGAVTLNRRRHLASHTLRTRLRSASESINRTRIAVHTPAHSGNSGAPYGRQNGCKRS